MIILTTRVEPEGTPSTFVLDAQGRVRHRHPGLVGYARTLYARESSRWVKVAYWCPSCNVGELLEAE